MKNLIILVLVAFISSCGVGNQFRVGQQQRHVNYPDMGAMKYKLLDKGWTIDKQTKTYLATNWRRSIFHEYIESQTLEVMSQITVKFTYVENNNSIETITAHCLYRKLYGSWYARKCKSPYNNLVLEAIESI